MGWGYTKPANEGVFFFKCKSGLKKSGHIGAFCDQRLEFCDLEIWPSRTFAPESQSSGVALQPSKKPLRLKPERNFPFTDKALVPSKNKKMRNFAFPCQSRTPLDKPKGWRMTTPSVAAVP